MKARMLVRALVAMLALGCAAVANAWIRSPAIAFAEMPAGVAYPEGIAADSQGTLYVTTFDIRKSTGPGTIVVVDRNGRSRAVDVAGTSPLLLGIAFHPQTGELLVCDLGAGKVLRVNLASATASVFATLPDVDPDPNVGPGPNALAFDASGNVYVSDSFQARVWRTGSGGGAVSEWVGHPLLGTSGVPPFGANGMAFDASGSALFVANTGNDTIVRVPVQAGGSAGTPAVFVNSINGADGIARDDDGNLWVAANQSDEIVVLDTTGRVIAKLGDFDGIDPKGAPRGLLFPASITFANGFAYVTNLALDLRNFGLAQTTNSAWSADVTRYTVSRLRAQVPPVKGH